MQVLNIIFTIVAIVANAAMTYFAVTAWFEFRKMKRSINVTAALTMSDHVRGNFEQLNEMRAAFRRLVKNEQYEEAEKLKTAIVKMEHNAETSLKQLKSLYGNICDVVMTDVSVRHDEERQ